MDKSVFSGCNTENDYMACLEFYAPKESSWMLALEEEAIELRTGPSLGHIYNQSEKEDSDQILYTIGGVAVFDIYSNHTEYKEYKTDVRNTKKELKQGLTGADVSVI